MYWATKGSAVPLSELGWINSTYLGMSTPDSDPMLVWGTTVDTDVMESFLADQRSQAGLMLTPMHVMVAAVAKALVQHPEFNRRVVGKRVYQYRAVNMVVPILNTRSGEVDSKTFYDAETLSLRNIAERFWEEAQAKARGAAKARSEATAAPTLARRLNSVWQFLRLNWLHRTSRIGMFFGNRLRLPTMFRWQAPLNHSGAFVNYLGFKGAAPLVAHKVAALPLNSYSVLVTMGASQPTAVVEDGEIVIRNRAHLFVRTDHRMVNGNQTGVFVETLRQLIANPAQLELGVTETVTGSDHQNRVAA